MRPRRAWLVAVAVVGPVLLVAQQVPSPQGAPTTGTGLIVGRAVDGPTGRPLAGVSVSMSASVAPGQAPPGPQSPGTSVLTAADGTFVFSGLAHGSFLINATKPGYVSGAYGRRAVNAGSQPLDLLDGDRRGDITIPLWKYGSISGRIVDEAGEPLLGVSVRVLRRAIVAGRWQLTQSGNQPNTDDRGMYRAGALSPGSYVVAVVTARATVPTSVQDAYVQGTTTNNTQAISRALDASGAAVTSAGIRIGSLMLQAPGILGTTLSGDTLLRMPEPDGRLFVYPTTFYPGAPTTAGATIISVAAGQERANVDFQLSPVPSVRVSGSVVGPEGPVPQIGLQLLPADADALARDAGFETAAAITDGSGAFTFLGVTPGSYVIKVLRSPQRPVSTDSGFASVVQVGNTTIFSGGATTPAPIPDEPTLSAVLPVTVADRDVADVAVTLRPGARISGQAQFIGTAPRPTADRLRLAIISIDPSDGRSPFALTVASTVRRAQYDAEGRITSYQLPPGKYLIRPGAIQGWTLLGATIDGKDVADTPFDLGAADIENLIVTFTDRPAGVSGTVREGARPDGQATVLVFPADSRGWTDYGPTSRRLRSVATNSDGTFRLTNVPPGDFLVIAVRDDIATDWQDPATLAKLATAATRVTILDGDAKIQNLDVKTIR